MATREFGLPTTRGVMSAGAATAQAGSELAAQSGRWVKLTGESAALIRKHGLRESKSGLKTGVVKGEKGQIKTFVQFARGPGTLTSPAVLAGAAGVMAQVAMRQTMDEITDYLASIDEKVEDVLRAQKDAVLAKVIGLGLVIEEALTIREHGGKVNEVTWSKVHSAPATIAEAQSYALRQLDALAEKLSPSGSSLTWLRRRSRLSTRRRNGWRSWPAAGNSRTRSPCWSWIGSLTPHLMTSRHTAEASRRLARTASSCWPGPPSA